MNVFLIEVRLFVVCDRCEVLEILSALEEDKKLASELKWHHMSQLPTHKVEVIPMEVEA